MKDLFVNKMEGKARNKKYSDHDRCKESMVKYVVEIANKD